MGSRGVLRERVGGRRLTQGTAGRVEQRGEFVTDKKACILCETSRNRFESVFAQASLRILKTGLYLLDDPFLAPRPLSRPRSN